jgi:maleylacetate reductase
VIVRWGLDALPPLLAELGSERPVVVSSERWSGLPLPVGRRWHGARAHTPADTVADALVAAEGADALVALGGGSAIDTAKAVSSRTGLPVVSIPTTYSGAEWTTFFGTLDVDRREKAGGGGARTTAIVYEPALTLGLPREETAGTALNALAHCAEALYAPGRTAETDDHALRGARLIACELPAVLARPHELEGRRGLLEGAMHAGAALRAGLGLAHAMAQALGGRYGVSHGAMNALCLPPALRFNASAAPDAVAAFGEAVGGDGADRAEELARLGGFRRLRDFGVAEADLAATAAATVVRGGARRNPRRATADEVEALLRSIW